MHPQQWRNVWWDRDDEDDDEDDGDDDDDDHSSLYFLAPSLTSLHPLSKRQEIIFQRFDIICWFCFPCRKARSCEIPDQIMISVIKWLLLYSEVMQIKMITIRSILIEFFFIKKLCWSNILSLITLFWPTELWQFYGVLAELEPSISFHILKSCSHLSNLLLYSWKQSN